MVESRDRPGTALGTAPGAVTVEVAYALPERQWLLTVSLAEGATIGDAIHAAKLREAIPEALIDDDHVGIFGRPCDLSTPVADGDRVEIYRDLAADPRTSRRRRAAHQRARR